MKIKYITPAAFNYFDDIKRNCFNLANKLVKLGLEVDVSTLQYGAISKKQAKKPAGESIDKTSLNFQGIMPLQHGMAQLSDYDIIHLHTPFLGAGRSILNFKKHNPGIPMLVTYYRPVEINDLLSFFIKLYNDYYLRKIFSSADLIACFARTAGRVFSNYDKNKIVDISAPADDDEHLKMKVVLTNMKNELKLIDKQIDYISIDKLLYIYEVMAG
ncbi:MAG: glycosyltransferase [bacterium]